MTVTTIARNLQQPELFEVETDTGIQSLRDSLNTRVSRLQDPGFTVTVGAGGDFATLNQALERVQNFRGAFNVSDGKQVEIKLLSGFVMNEQVFMKDVNMNHVQITSEDSVVYVNTSALTEFPWGNDGGKPIFGFDGASCLSPKIGVQFELTDSTDDQGVSGIVGLHGSTIEMLPESGVRGASRGLNLMYGSKAVCSILGLRSVSSSINYDYGVDFSNTNGRALAVQFGSSCSLPRSKFNNSGKPEDSAVYIIWGCTADLVHGDVQNSASAVSGVAAVRVRDNSRLCFREGDVSGSAGAGLHASHNANVDYRSASEGSGRGGLGARNCGRQAVWATSASFIDCTSLVATNCAQTDSTLGAIQADGASIIHAGDVDASGSGGKGFYAISNSTVMARYGVARDCQYEGAYADSSSLIDARQLAATGCAKVGGDVGGIGAYQASTVNAQGANVSESGGAGFLAQESSTINAASSIANDCARHGVYALNNGNVGFSGASATGCQWGVHAHRGSTVDMDDAEVTGATGTFGIRAQRGSRINAYNARCRQGSIDGEHDIDVVDGGIVCANDATGGLSQSANTPTSEGIIFR